MMKRLAACLIALALSAGGAAQADQLLPQGRILDSGPNSGDILFGALKLGRRSAGKTTLTPDTLQIQGAGSTGPIDGMSLTLRGLTTKLADLFGGRVPNWTEYGAGSCKGNAAADTAAFQAAVAAGGRFTLYCSQPILLNDGAVATKVINIDADNNSAPINLTAAFPQTSDVLTLRPAVVAGNFYGWRVAGLKVNAVVNGRGRHFLTIDLSAGNGASLTGLTVERNQVGDVQGTVDGFQNMGAAAIRFIPHATQADQLFVSTISRNYLTGGPGFTDGQGNVAPGGGIFMRRAGDSLHLDENWIKGPGRAIDVEFITGAANYTIQRNNFTSSGGAIRLRYGFRGSIEDNQIELLSAWTGDSDQSLIVLNDTDGTAIDKNNINADLGNHSAALTADAISLLGNTARTEIRSGNRIAVNSAAGRYHLSTASTVTATAFWPGQRIENPYLTIASRTTDVLSVSIGQPGSVRGLWFPLTLQNGWAGQSTGGAVYEGLFARIGLDGTVNFRGNMNPGTLAAGTLIATLPANAAPAKTMRLFAAQARPTTSYLPAGFTVSPSGGITTTYALPDGLPVSFDSTVLQTAN